MTDETEPAEQGLTLPELAAALEIWTKGDEPYCCFVHPHDAGALANRLAHPALDIYETRQVGEGEVFVWMRKDVPDGLIQMSSKVRTYRRLRG